MDQILQAKDSDTTILRAGALGKFGAIALGVGMMGPALAIYANLGPIAASAGITSPAIFLVALLLTLPSAATRLNLAYAVACACLWWLGRRLITASLTRSAQPVG
jgi:hypothetical protein